jgi:hypothetical protein
MSMSKKQMQLISSANTVHNVPVRRCLLFSCMKIKSPLLWVLLFVCTLLTLGLVLFLADDIHAEEEGESATERFANEEVPKRVRKERLNRLNLEDNPYEYAKRNGRILLPKNSFGVKNPAEIVTRLSEDTIKPLAAALNPGSGCFDFKPNPCFCLKFTLTGITWDIGRSYRVPVSTIQVAKQPYLTEYIPEVLTVAVKKLNDTINYSEGILRILAMSNAAWTVTGVNAALAKQGMTDFLDPSILLADDKAMTQALKDLTNIKDDYDAEKAYPDSRRSAIDQNEFYKMRGLSDGSLNSAFPTVLTNLNRYTFKALSLALAAAFPPMNAVFFKGPLAVHKVKGAGVFTCDDPRHFQACYNKLAASGFNDKWREMAEERQGDPFLQTKFNMNRENFDNPDEDAVPDDMLEPMINEDAEDLKWMLRNGNGAWLPATVHGTAPTEPMMAQVGAVKGARLACFLDKNAQHDIDLEEDRVQWISGVEIDHLSEKCVKFDEPRETFKKANLQEAARDSKPLIGVHWKYVHGCAADVGWDIDTCNSDHGTACEYGDSGNEMSFGYSALNNMVPLAPINGVGGEQLLALPAGGLPGDLKDIIPIAESLGANVPALQGGVFNVVNVNENGISVVNLEDLGGELGGMLNGAENSPVKIPVFSINPNVVQQITAIGSSTSTGEGIFSDINSATDTFNQINSNIDSIVSSGAGGFNAGQLQQLIGLSSSTGGIGIPIEQSTISFGGFTPSDLVDQNGQITLPTGVVLPLGMGEFLTSPR